MPIENRNALDLGNILICVPYKAMYFLITEFCSQCIWVVGYQKE